MPNCRYVAEYMCTAALGEVLDAINSAKVCELLLKVANANQLLIYTE